MVSTTAKPGPQDWFYQVPVLGYLKVFARSTTTNGPSYGAAQLPICG